MMKQETYEKISAPFRATPGRAKALVCLNKILTYLTYATYLALVISQLILDLQICWRVLLIPAVGFGAVTVFRKKFNAPRPYELLDIKPLIPRNKQGQSFPSRHAFSIFMITMAVLYVYPPLGIAYLVLAVLLAVVRVIGGVHFPKDVLAGALIAVVWGLVGFSLVSGGFGWLAG